jgi:cytochrome P450
VPARKALQMNGPVVSSGLTALHIPDPRRPAAPLPPAQRLPLLQAWRVIRENPIAAFPDEAYREPVVSRLGLLSVNDPAAVEHVLVTNAGNYRKSGQQQRRLRPALRDGLLTAEGEVWRSARRAAAPLFTPRAVTALFDDMVHAAEAMRERWRADYTGGEPVSMAREFQRLTYEVVSRTVFSGALDEDRMRVHEQTALYLDTIRRVDLAAFLNLPEWVSLLGHLRARSAIGIFRDVVTRVFNERITQKPRGESGDLLDRLISARDPQTGEPLPNPVILDNVLTFLAAGHETTANTLSWLSYLLGAFPWADEEMAAEMKRVLQGRPATVQDLEHLTFTRAVIDETLRVYPPAPFMGREAVEADELCGIRIKAGQPVLLSPWILHRHKRVWEQPELFAPQRFLPPTRDAIPRGAYIPFGLGPRICIGQGFALQEIMIVLSVIIPHYRFELAAPDDVMPLSRLSLQPVSGPMAYLRPRYH